MNKFGIGQPVPRVEDPRFITGRGRYVDDFDLPRQCYGVVVMSPHAHARIKRVDTAKAKAAAGVLAVLTGADVKADKLGGLAPPMPEDMGGPKGLRTLRAILEADKVRAVGDRVAFVVAETLAQARDAAELIEIDYEPLPAVVGVEDAVKPGAPALWDEAPNNVAFTLMMGNKDATDAAFANAKHVVSLKLNNSRITANSIEPRAAIGQYHPDSDSYTLYSTSQNPHGTRSAVAGQVLKIPETKLRVISPDVGGGFGMKHGGYPEDALVVWASRRVGGRPVKWVSTRSEALLGDSQGRDQVVTGELALDERGKILGLRVNALHAMGSHVFGAAMVVPLFAMRLAPGVYQIPAVHAVARAVLTNAIPTAPYRGAGRPEATYLIEQLLDRAARVIGIDPVEIRRRNFIPSAAMPHKLQTGITYDSGDFVHVMDECLKLADWNGFAKRAAESKKQRQAARPRHRLFPRRSRRLQRPHGAALRSERHAHHSCRHAFARPGPPDGLFANGVGMARRAVREHPLRARRHRRGADRARQLRLAQHACRRQRAQARRRRHRREGKADGGDDAGGRRRRHRVQGRRVPHRRHRPRARPDRRRQGVLSPGDAAAAIRRRARSLRHVRRRTAELSERLPRLRGRDRSGNRRGDA